VTLEELEFNHQEMLRDLARNLFNNGQITDEFKSDFKGFVKDVVPTGPSTASEPKVDAPALVNLMMLQVNECAEFDRNYFQNRNTFAQDYKSQLKIELDKLKSHQTSMQTQSGFQPIQVKNFAKVMSYYQQNFQVPDNRVQMQQSGMPMQYMTCSQLVSMNPKPIQTMTELNEFIKDYQKNMHMAWQNAQTANTDNETLKQKLNTFGMGLMEMEQVLKQVAHAAIHDIR
jgi:hypothetical protein